MLARLAAAVWSVERIPELASGARATLDRLGIRNVSIRVADGRKGWPEEAPFDSILVTAAAETIPANLVEQLRPGGRLVIPLESLRGPQQLVLLEKNPSGQSAVHEILPVRFVPLVRGH